MVSPGDWLVSSIWFLLSIGLVAIGRWDKSASSCRVVSTLLLFLLGSSCIALQLQLCLVISCPSKVRKFNFEYCLLSHQISSGIYHMPHFQGLTCCPSPALSLCDSPDLCWVLDAPLENGLLPHTHSFCCALPILIHWEFSSLSHSSIRGRFSVPPPSPLPVLDHSSLFMLFSLVCGVQASLDYVPGRWVGHWCMMLTWSFCSCMQAALKPAAMPQCS
jgi:hypothetical protein